MRTQEPVQATTVVASPAEVDAVAALMSEPEAPVSDAPCYTPVASSGAFLLQTPKAPKEPRKGK